MKCPNDYCGGMLSVHNTDLSSEYYCLDGCGYEERVTWQAPVKTKRQIFNQPSAPRQKKVQRDR